MSSVASSRGEDSDLAFSLGVAGKDCSALAIKYLELSACRVGKQGEEGVP